MLCLRRPRDPPKLCGTMGPSKIDEAHDPRSLVVRHLPACVCRALGERRRRPRPRHAANIQEEKKPTDTINPRCPRQSWRVWEVGGKTEPQKWGIL
eukprot:8538145-Pyramimonas_sp.AAC.1